MQRPHVLDRPQLGVVTQNDVSSVSWTVMKGEIVEERIIREVGVGVPPWGQTILFGIGAAGIAGLVVLAPGFRLAMRIVAIQDPFRQTEFSVPGTIFIMIFIGLIVAVPLGLIGAVLNRLLPRPVTILIMTVLGMALVAADSVILEELTNLGWGPLMNVSMFAGVFLLYAIVDLRLLSRFMREVASAEAGLAQEEVSI